jgi:hypothetical protein
MAINAIFPETFVFINANLAGGFPVVIEAAFFPVFLDMAIFLPRKRKTANRIDL